MKNSKPNAPRSNGVGQASANAARCRRKFLRYFPKGFYDPKYIDWESGYKWKAHEQ